MRFMKRKVEEETLRKDEQAKRQKLLNPQWSSKEQCDNDEDSNQDKILSESAMQEMDGETYLRMSGSSSSSSRGNRGKIEYVGESENEVYSLFPGRRSFGGFNLVIERYCEKLLEDQKFERISRSNISDEEMVHRYEKMVRLSNSGGGGGVLGKNRSSGGKKKKSKGNNNNNNKS